MNPEKTTERRDGFYMPAGRRFGEVPRVLACHNDMEAVVFFHGADAPHGGPRAVYELYKTQPEEQRKIRFYGVATKMSAARYARFNAEIHVIDDAKIPTDGTDYHVVDPASARNFAMVWIRYTKDGDSYVVREWPGNYNIPGVGHPGAWTENDARKPDGRRGPAQKKFGWGLLDYKREIARLEGWKDYKDAQKANWDWTKCKTISQWLPWHGADAHVVERIIDSRAASSPRVENDRETSLQAAFADIGLPFTLAKGEDLEAGDSLIDTALAWEVEKPRDFFNRPKLYVARSCVNTIYMFENFTGLTDRGTTDFDSACKEWADLLRYYFLARPRYVPKGARLSRPGGYF